MAAFGQQDRCAARSLPRLRGAEAGWDPPPLRGGRGPAAGGSWRPAPDWWPASATSLTALSSNFIPLPDPL